MLFKLHGSTCWVGDIKSLGTSDEPEDSPEYGFESEEQSPFEIVYPGYRREVWLGDENWNILHDPEGGRVPWMEREPYSVLYEHLDCCLANAVVLVVIGNSFHDHYINEQIVRALRENSRLNVIVLDPGNVWSRRLPNGGLQKVIESPYSWTIEFGELDLEASRRIQWIRGRFGSAVATRKLVGLVNEIL